MAENVIPVEGAVEGGVEVYSSSEELQRHNASVFANKEAEKQKKKQLTDKERLLEGLDKYIAKYSTTTTVRKMAEEKKRTADYQLDLSADIVEILNKIKSDLR